VDAVFEADLVEVDEEAEWDVHEPHVAEKLGAVDGENLLNGFELDEEGVGDQEVEAEGFLEGDAFVFDSDDLLAAGRDLTEFEFSLEALFVDALDETGTFDAMDFHLLFETAFESTGPVRRDWWLVQRMVGRVSR
jgi:hypothetical protein